MKYALTFFVAILVAACSQQNGGQPQYLVGNWTNAEMGGEFTLWSNGRFQSEWKSPQKELRFEGTWFVSNSILVSTITNVVTRNIETSNFAAVGSIERGAIIPIDANHFAFRYEASSNYFRTNLFTRMP